MRTVQFVSETIDSLCNCNSNHVHWQNAQLVKHHALIVTVHLGIRKMASVGATRGTTTIEKYCCCCWVTRFRSLSFFLYCGFVQDAIPLLVTTVDPFPALISLLS